MPITAHQPQYSMILEESGIGCPLVLSKIRFNTSELFDLFKQYMENMTINTPEKKKYGQTLASEYASFDSTTKTVDFACYGGEEYMVGKFFLETNLNWPQEYIDSCKKFYNPKYKQAFNVDAENEKLAKGNPIVFMSSNKTGNISMETMDRMNAYATSGELKIKKPVSSMINLKMFDNNTSDTPVESSTPSCPIF